MGTMVYSRTKAACWWIHDGRVVLTAAVRSATRVEGRYTGNQLRRNIPASLLSGARSLRDATLHRDGTAGGCAVKH